ncbi:MAG: TAXI family TRAP transporter solute-binding subunit [Planctomycetota bacterium]|jgi:TRAP transporter TAXI family solute receptor
MSFGKSLVAAAAVALLGFASAPTAVAQDSLTLSTGSKGGTYHAIGKGIRDIAFAKGVDMDITTSAGSGENLLMTAFGVADMSLIQLDAFTLFGDTAEGKAMISKIKIVAPLYLEEVHIVVKADSSIKKFEDLVGKRINVGPGASGSYVTAQVLLKRHGIADGDVRFDHRESPSALEALNKGEIDALFFTGGKPVPFLKNLPENAGLRLVGCDASEKYEFPYVASAIEAGTYSWQKEAVSTPATLSLLCARSGVSAETVETLTKAIVLSQNSIVGKKQSHEKWNQLDATVGRDLFKAGLPFHRGAANVFGVEPGKGEPSK